MEKENQDVAVHRKFGRALLCDEEEPWCPESKFFLSFSGFKFQVEPDALKGCDWL